MSRPHVAAQCPVCDHGIALPLHDGGRPPRTTGARPASAEAALAVERRRLDVVQCPSCWHVWNRAGDVGRVPLDDARRRTWSLAADETWAAHVAFVRGALLGHLPAIPTVVVLGADGDGFAAALAASRPGRYLAFDPSAPKGLANGIENLARPFDPLVDLPALTPDLVIVRHALDRELRPTALIDQLAWAATTIAGRTWLHLEVACVDRVLETGRFVDFHPERLSYFTTESFEALARRAGRPEALDTGCNGEVAWALVRLDVPAERRIAADATSRAAARNAEHRGAIAAQLHSLGECRIAVWGGSGRAVSFMHRYGIDAMRFPLVVETDPSLVGTFVPGSGQEIVHAATLARAPVDAIVVPEPWRARDILAAVWREGITVKQVRIEHDGRLVDYQRDAHPYRAGVPATSGVPTPLQSANDAVLATIR